MGETDLFLELEFWTCTEGLTTEMLLNDVSYLPHS